VAIRCKQTTPSLWPKPKPDGIPSLIGSVPSAIGFHSGPRPLAGSCWVGDRWSGSPRPRQCSERGTHEQDPSLRTAMPVRALEDPTRQRHSHGSNTLARAPAWCARESTTTDRAPQRAQKARASGRAIARQGRECARADAGEPGKQVGCPQEQARRTGCPQGQTRDGSVPGLVRVRPGSGKASRVRRQTQDRERS
jgi:hypothetical protein